MARQAAAIVGPPAVGGGSGRLGARQAPSADRLVEAGLELDRVVDGEADQDRQGGDRGHRQGAAEEAEEAEDERRGGQGERQRQQAQARAEDEQQGQRHHHQGDGEEDEQGVLQRACEAVDDDRGAGDDVAAALQLEAGRRPRRLSAQAWRGVVSATAASISPSARWRSASLRSGFSRTTIWAEWLFGKR